MATHKLDDQGVLRVTDTGTNMNRTTYGMEDLDQSDFIEFIGNGTSRWIEAGSSNAGEDETEIPTLLRGMVGHPSWHTFEDDFYSLIPVDDTTLNPTNGWAIVSDLATARLSAVDTAGGWMRVSVDSTDNDETYLASAGESWLFADNKPLIFMTKITHTAGSTDGKSSFVVGLSDTVGANSIVDAGTLMTSYDGCVFFKDEDGSHILFASSNAATQSSADLVAWTDADTFEGGFVFDSAGGTTGTLTPFYLTTASDWSTITYGTAQTITLAGLAEMHFFIGAKTHEASAQTLDIDYVKVLQKR